MRMLMLALVLLFSAPALAQPAGTDTRAAPIYAALQAVDAEIVKTTPTARNWFLGPDGKGVKARLDFIFGQGSSDLPMYYVLNDIITAGARYAGPVVIRGNEPRPGQAGSPVPGDLAEALAVRSFRMGQERWFQTPDFNIPVGLTLLAYWKGRSAQPPPTVIAPVARVTIEFKDGRREVVE